ncbi:N-acetylneuraminate synthase [Flavobacterium cyanobacteriorum]|uniref:N-acetylneuraminate synthase n=1 Tax=Flavobacterium cyanobacteriorum TaxID=2022802 RepID=A0A255YSB0_9FLAO|nr:N-acetylneuraminate synthase [Flavobacterium cyanobacteriorum]OYQ32102.1 N-acetylneuraminate synthase [Flavobacterium cyanobacteriorum]
MEKVLIIAEAGVNHNGDLELAKQLVDAAAEAKADYVKFQTFKADKIVSKNAQKADYQIKNINDNDNSQYAMLKKLEMPDDWHYQLLEYAQSKNIKFLSTGFDQESIDFLDKLGVDLYKIPSGEITNKRYLQHIARKNKEIIISTGMATLDEIKQAVNIIAEAGTPKEKISVLHCNTEYPTPMKDVNLKAMNRIGKELGVTIGYSDHTLGIEVPIAAVALGAKIIEKHFTIDRNLPGPDHLASLEPAELKQMVTSIRNIEQAISGNGSKEPSESEKKNIAIVRKSLHFNKNLDAGHVLREEDLIAIRPGTGVSPLSIDDFIGKKLNTAVTANTPVFENYFL